MPEMMPLAKPSAKDPPVAAEIAPPNRPAKIPMMAITITSSTKVNCPLGSMLFTGSSCA